MGDRYVNGLLAANARGDAMARWPAAPIACAFALCIVAAPAGAHAQGGNAPEWPRLRVRAGVSLGLAGPDGSLSSSYSPPLLLDGEFTSLAGQTLRLDTGSAPGITAGIDVFLSPRLGFGLVIDSTSFDVAGTNAPYAFNLHYISRQPPDDRAQPVDLTRSIDWPDTVGSARQVAIAFNAIARAGPVDRLNLTVSAGPCIYRWSGTVQPLGYTAFQLGGHSVLFEDEYRLAAALKPHYGFGVDVGADLNVPIAHRAALLVGVRYFHAGDAALSATPAAILNADQLTLAQPLAAITSSVGSLPVRVAASGPRLVAGLTLVP